MKKNIENIKLLELKISQICNSYIEILQKKSLRLNNSIISKLNIFDSVVFNNNIFSELYKKSKLYEYYDKYPDVINESKMYIQQSFLILKLFLVGLFYDYDVYVRALELIK